MGLVSGNEGHRERLRQRFVRSGFAGFAEYEVVELLLTFCLPRKDVKPHAKLLIKKFGSIREVIDADPEELKKISGLGTVAPIAIKFVKKIAEIYLEQTVAQERCIIDNYDRLWEFWRLRLGGIKYEVFEVAFLDTHLKLLKDGVVRMEEGSADRTSVNPRKIMEYALQKHASAIIIAHNHPSGSPMPSDGDYIVTKKIEKAAEALGIRFIDHIIIAQTEVYSFRKSGFIGVINPS